MSHNCYFINTIWFDIITFIVQLVTFKYSRYFSNNTWTEVLWYLSNTWCWTSETSSHLPRWESHVIDGSWACSIPQRHQCERDLECSPVILQVPIFPRHHNHLLYIANFHHPRLLFMSLWTLQFPVFPYFYSSHLFHCRWWVNSVSLFKNWCHVLKMKHFLFPCQISVLVVFCHCIASFQLIKHHTYIVIL